MPKFSRYIELLKEIGKEIEELHIKDKLGEVMDYLEKKVGEETDTILISDEVLTIYTDGACRGNPGPGAWAYLIMQQGQTLEEDTGVDIATTNNRMELLAVIEGLKRAKGLGAKGVQLYSDSQYVVNGISQWVPNWKRKGWKKSDNKTPENVDLWQELDDVNQQLNVKYNWVKGHAGNEYNERVDELANYALDINGH
jgi:ribonuclease HI